MTRIQSHPSVTELRFDAAAWDAFVERTPGGAYPQLTPWAAVKEPNGWRAERVVADGGSGPIGALLLVHALPPTPWGVGYAARGPIAARWDAASVRAFTLAMQQAARRHRLSHVTIDPEVRAGEGVEQLLRAAGWRHALESIQPIESRIVDLRPPEEEVWRGLRSKSRQYVEKARRGGVAIVETGVEGIDDFHRILAETADRAGFLHRTPESYRQVFEAYAAQGAARLLFARLPDGTSGATLMLIGCCRRVVEPYGGMTDAGAVTRANYLIKWEAIRSSRAAGYEAYDMWGLPNAGIAQFKAGFGGEIVRYVGAWDLVVNAPVRAGLMAAHRVRQRLAHRAARADRNADAE